MDRTLADAYGVPYVHLVAFSIDIDRVFERAPADAELPIGWEVFLCARYVQGSVDSGSESGRGMLEDTVLHILAAAPEEPRLGGVLAFGIHAAVERGKLDARLAQAFSNWRSPSKQLRRALDRCFGDSMDLVVAAAGHCLSTSIVPPPSPPTLDALREMAAGQWRSAVVPATPPKPPA